MLNFTCGHADLKSALRTARGQARRHRPPLHRAGQAAKASQRPSAKSPRSSIWRMCAPGSSLSDKLAALAGSLLPRLAGGAGRIATSRRRSFSPPAPKASPRAWRSVTPISWPMSPRCAPISIFMPRDVLFNPLPVFHCFGLTVGMLLPLIAGVKVVCHPTPAAAARDRAAHPRASAPPSCFPPTPSSPNMPAAAKPAISTVCAWRCAAPSGCATRPAPVLRRKYGMEIAGRLWRHRSRARDRRQPDRGQPSRHGGPADGGHGGAAGAGRRHSQRRAALE